MVFYENTGILGFTKDENDKVKEECILLADGTVYHTAEINPTDRFMTESYVKNVQADLDELPMIVGFRPMKYLKQLEVYGLKIPTEKIVDLLDAEENGQKFDSALSLAKRWNESYADNLKEPYPFYKEMELGRALYIRICNNDDTPNPPQETSIFDYEDRNDPDDDGLPF